MIEHISKHTKIFIAGHRGLAGSAILRSFQQRGFTNLLARTHSELDLADDSEVRNFFSFEQPDVVVLAAAKVGGIMAHRGTPASFLMENLRIQNNVIDAAYRTGVKRLLFLGSSCIYPRECPQPIREEYLLSGQLEHTNRAYALAKIAGVEACWAYNRQYGTRFLAVMPTNLYGPNDNYDLETSHVLPALLRKIHTARLNNDPEIVVWGTGQPRREFLYSDDMGDACVFLTELPDEKYLPLVSSSTEAPIMNLGCGSDVTIRELAELIMDVIGYRGKIVFDKTKPDGTPRKLLDVSRFTALGWHAKTELREGIAAAYQSFMKEHPELVTAMADTKASGFGRNKGTRSSND